MTFFGSLLCRIGMHGWCAWSPTELRRIWVTCYGNTDQEFSRRVCLRCGRCQEMIVAQNQLPTLPLDPAEQSARAAPRN